jgi:type 1 glutamine amidotransferase
MNRATIFIRRLFIISFALTMFTHCTYRSKEDLIKVLILSGKNNHEWQKTTPLLIRIFKDSRLFTINVTEKPDTLTYKDFIKFDVVVSNWNTWPDNDFRFSNAWENDFLRYVKRGGGFVTFHAGASSFYGWEEYHRIGIGRWGKETSHGNLQKGKISDFDQLHTITKGLRDFYVIDEIWEKTDIHQAARVIASVSATEGNNGNPINEPAVFVSQTGKGRCFFTILGHNERALLNTGLQTLLLRASQWAAHHKVTIKPPQEINAVLTSGSYNNRWEESDTTFGLLKNNAVIWRYNFNNRFGKPYFHPVTVKNSPVTCLSPPDHPWHLGLWFSWKFITGSISMTLSQTKPDTDQKV